MARLGRWCFRHRWWVLLIWVVAVAAGVLSIGPMFSGLAEDNNPRAVESIEAFEVMSAGNESGGQVVVLVDRADAQAPEVRDAVTRAASDLAGLPDVKEVGPPVPSRDGQALLISVVMADVERPARDVVIDKVTERADRLDAELPDARVRVGGQTVLNRQANAAVQEDLLRAEIISLPITLIVLVVVFGGLVAAGLPVLAAIVSVASAMTVLLGFTLITDVDTNAVTVVTLLGLGLSIDYGLLLVARYREELTAGFDPEVAVGRAWATAGRTILFSALTVAAALAGLLTFEVQALRALGAAGVSIALVSMLAALTFTAALLGLAHRRIRPSRHSGARQKRPASDDTGFFARLSGFVQRRPLPIALATAAVLLAAGAPLLSATVKLPGLEGMPRSLEAVQVAEDMRERFGEAYAPEVVVLGRTDVDALDDWARPYASDPAVAEVRDAEALRDGVAQVTFALRGGAQDDAAQALVERIRDNRPPGGQSWVTGDAAILTDLVDMIVEDLPLALTVTLVSMILLLFAMTGSLVVPIKAILANVVSLGAAFGVLVAVFEHGWLAGILDTLTIGGLDPFVIVITFAFAFGLSMDYEVFLLGRIKEYVDRGWDTDTAVRRGLQHTGRIITSAALLMLVVFACFAAARVGSIEQIGLGLTVAVIIDATIVRCLLVPATMTLLGRLNWWAPAPLKRLHEKIGLRETVLDDAPSPAEPREPADASV